MKTQFTVLFLFVSVLLSFGQKSFMHPEAQINFVKKQLKQKKELYHSAFLQLKEVADKALLMPDHALEDFSVPGYYQNPEEHRQNSLHGYSLP